MTARTRTRLRKYGDNVLSVEDRAKLGVRARDGDTIEAEMAALDSLPPLLRQHLNESLFEWSAVTVAHALRVALASNPARGTEGTAVDIVLWLAGEEQRMAAAAEAERTAAQGLKPC